MTNATGKLKRRLEWSSADIDPFDFHYSGNTYGRYNATENSNCFFQCNGKYTCGGYNANSVYYISNSKWSKLGCGQVDAEISEIFLSSCNQSSRCRAVYSLGHCQPVLVVAMPQLRNVYYYNGR